MSVSSETADYFKFYKVASGVVGLSILAESKDMKGVSVLSFSSQVLNLEGQVYVYFNKEFLETESFLLLYM
jgi:hypothetical protein